MVEWIATQIVMKLIAVLLTAVNQQLNNLREINESPYVDKGWLAKPGDPERIKQLELWRDVLARAGNNLI